MFSTLCNDGFYRTLFTAAKIMLVVYGCLWLFASPDCFLEETGD